MPLPLALAALGLTLTTAAAAAGRQAARFSLQPFPPRSPAYFVFTAERGERLSGTLQLANVGTATGTATLYPVDATTSDGGGAAYLARTATRRDVGRWLHLAVSRVTLKPRQQALVPFVLRVPAKERAGQHLGGIVVEDAKIASGQTTRQRARFQIRFRHLTIVAVEVRLPGASKVGVRATGVRAATWAERQTILLGLRNAGTLIVRPTGSLVIRDATHRVVKRVPLNIDTFLPQTWIEYPIFVRGRPLSSGTYTAIVVLRYGARGITRWHRTFTIPPLAD